MPKVRMVVVAGFLGSGKTSLIIATLSRMASGDGGRTVVIVNDYGTVGVDSELMERSGLKVTELPSGCICCSLEGDFVYTVEQVVREFSPALIVVEPTGVADPANVRQNLAGYNGPPFQDIRTLVVVDAMRFQDIVRALPKPMESQIKVADLVVINKIEGVDHEELAKVLALVSGLGGKEVVQASITAETNIEPIIRWLGAKGQ